MTDLRNPFRLNVGFIVAETTGYFREFPFSVPAAQIQELRLSNIEGTALVTRTGQGLLVQVDLRAETPAECIRCLDAFSQELHPTFTELFAFQRTATADTELIVPETGQLDLSPLVREYMLLDMPIKPICRPECKGLCPVCGENQNLKTCQHDNEDIDPRLAGLKSLLDG